MWNFCDFCICYFCICYCSLFMLVSQCISTSHSKLEAEWVVGIGKAGGESASLILAWMKSNPAVKFCTEKECFVGTEKSASWNTVWRSYHWLMCADKEHGCVRTHTNPFVKECTCHLAEAGTLPPAYPPWWLSGYRAALLSTRSQVRFLAMVAIFWWRQNAKTLVYCALHTC